MNKKVCLIFMVFQLAFSAQAQETKLWTEADRKYLLDNLIRSRDELVKETKGLSKAQWEFKESPDRWSINQIVEHIAIWELLLDHDISKQLGKGPQWEYVKTAKADSVVLGFIMEEEKHVSTDYTKPFTYTLPMGLNDLKNNVAWFLKMRNESVAYVTGTQDDLRVYFQIGGGSNMHQRYITVFGHTDRHLRQIRKVKQHPGYPKS
ncbi:DinB family protein [Chryseolinea lacunae]|uniref:DinB family protein n=1 Tax=Chryseolinea lacunae TaxID=2801331 RepID=A0ABS1KZC0_9BACT|nr:DinB family protein [Chryseolinea lacunae]MBL0744795.1 DinB family protein [Chryseolinea lacunae]